ncbi:MAG: glycosyltransferase [Sulfurimonas sp.]|nr:glycosyltransferase [Sulfurimonas sp.]
MAYVNINPEKKQLFDQLCRVGSLPPAGRLFSEIKMGVVASDALHKHLASECDIVSIRRDDFLGQFDQEFDLVFIHVSLDLPSAWRQTLLYEQSQIEHILAICAQKSIPVCFYYDAGVGCWDLFDKLLLSGAEFVFSTCTETQQKLIGEGRKNCHVIPPLLSSKLINPYQEQADRDLRRSVGYIVPEWATLATALHDNDWIQLATLENIQVFDERISRKPVKFPLPGEAKKTLLGSLDESASVALYKNSYVCIILDVPAARHRQLENLCKAMGYGVPVITTLPVAMLPSGLPCLFADNVAEAVRLAGELKKNGMLRDALANMSLKAFESNIALYRTFAWMFERMTDRFLPIAEPMVSFVMPTIRFDLIADAIRSYDKFKYKNKELVVAVNNDAIVLADCLKMVRDRSDIRFLHVPQSEPVGRCLNVAIEAAHGDFIAKIDDDDVYGPDYLLGFIHALRSVAFDLAGKVPAFWYEEDENSLLIKREFWKYHSCYKHLMGGTFFFRHDGVNRYDETVRGYADLEMQERMHTDGKILLSVDCFDYVHVRRGGGHHTWKLTSDDIRLATYFISVDKRFFQGLTEYWEKNFRTDSVTQSVMGVRQFLSAEHYFYFQENVAPVKNSQEVRKIPRKKSLFFRGVLFLMLMLESGYLSLKKKLMAKVDA